MIKRMFEWGQDEEFGIWGWIPKGMPGFNASFGLGVAHDTLEHFVQDGTDLTAELNAFGAMLYIRAEGDYWYNSDSRHGEPEYHMSADLGRFAAESIIGNISSYDSFIERPPKPRKLDERAEEILSSVINTAKHDATNMIEEYVSEDEQHKYLNQLDAKLKDITCWLRHGYKRAIKRYHHNDAYQMAYLFQRISDTVDLRHKHGDFGEVLTIKVNPKTLEHTISQAYAYEGY